MTVLKVDSLSDRRIYCFAGLGCMCALFSPEVGQAGAVKWLIQFSSIQILFFFNDPIRGEFVGVMAGS